MRNASVLMSGWASLLVLAVVADAAIIVSYGNYGQQRQTSRNPFGQYRQPVATTRIPYSGQYRQPVATTRIPYSGQYRQPVATTRIPYSGQYRQPVATTRIPYRQPVATTRTPYRRPVSTTRQNNLDQKTIIRLVAGNESLANSTFVYYVCRNGVCVRHYTAGFYSTVSIGSILALLILTACVGSAIVVRRRQVAALHYSVISDADARPLLGRGRGLSIQSDPVLLARV